MLAAIDIGGAFVDLYAAPREGAPIVAKVPRRDAPVAELVHDALRAGGIAPDRVAELRLSTTLAANALIAGTAAPVALVATRGFRDLPDLGRQSRRDPDRWPAPPPTPRWLSPEAWRFELPGRIDVKGEEAEPLAPETLDALRALPPGTPVAICLLFAHRNPAHEIAAARRVAAMRPDLPLSLSHLVDPKPREFERMLATMIDAALKPLARGFAMPSLPPPRVMGAEGALLDVDTMLARPLAFLQSGPAAGARGIARWIEGGDAIGLDIGSTTTEVSLHRAGAPLIAEEVVLPDLAIRCPTLDVTSLPFGGERPRSIAWLAEQIRRLAFHRNIDPRAAKLVIGGGAAPRFAQEIAAALGVDRVLVPPEAAVLAATGLAA